MSWKKFFKAVIVIAVVVVVTILTAGTGTAAAASIGFATATTAATAVLVDVASPPASTTADAHPLATRRPRYKNMSPAKSTCKKKEAE